MAHLPPSTHITLLKLSSISAFRQLALSVALLIIFLTSHVHTSRACQICTPFPRESSADLLLAAEAVVFAREDPERPFRFSTIKNLKGDPGEQPIDLFLDSNTRRILTTRPDRSVVLALIKADCGATLWRRIGLADDDFGPVVQRILDAAESWKADPSSRFDFFTEWLGHSNTQLRTLAHIEIARAPYYRIRECGGKVSREEIYRFLGNVRYMEWHPLYILLLASSEHPEDHEKIRQSFRSSAEFGLTTKLSAWTTAYIEIAEDEAIDAIEELFFSRADRSPEELMAVQQALSVHGNNGHVHLRDRIIASYAVLLKKHPERAVDLLSDLKMWRRTDLSSVMADIVADPPESIDVQSLLQLRRHVLTQMRSNLKTGFAPAPTPKLK